MLAIASTPLSARMTFTNCTHVALKPPVGFTRCSVVRLGMLIAMMMTTMIAVGMAIAIARLPLCFGPNAFTSPSSRIVPIVAGAMNPGGTPN